MPVDTSGLFKTVNMAFASANGFSSGTYVGFFASEIIIEDNIVKVKLMTTGTGQTSGTSFNNIPCSLCVVGTY